MKLLLLLSFLIVLLLVALPASAGTTRQVSVTNYEYSPERVRIRRGNRVRWNFQEGSHNVVGNGWGISALQSSGSWSKRFNRRGRFPYRCTIHGGMNGVVRVR